MAFASGRLSMALFDYRLYDEIADGWKGVFDIRPYTLITVFSIPCRSDRLCVIGHLSCAFSVR